jgi:hypothetical protein
MIGNPELGHDVLRDIEFVEVGTFSDVPIAVKPATQDPFVRSRKLDPLQIVARNILVVGGSCWNEASLQPGFGIGDDSISQWSGIDVPTFDPGCTRSARVRRCTKAHFQVGVRRAESGHEPEKRFGTGERRELLYPYPSQIPALVLFSVLIRFEIAERQHRTLRRRPRLGALSPSPAQRSVDPDRLLNQVLELDQFLSQDEAIGLLSIGLSVAHPVQKHRKAFTAGSGATVEDFIDIASLKKSGLWSRLGGPQDFWFNSRCPIR